MVEQRANLDYGAEDRLDEDAEILEGDVVAGEIATDDLTDRPTDRRSEDDEINSQASSYGSP